MHKHCPTDEPVLVIGCGTSTMSVEMHESGRFPHIVNIDVSTVAIEKMRAQTAGVAGLEWTVMSCTKMDFPDATFDMVFDKGTIDAVVCQTKGNECASQTLAEVHRVLKPGGRFILISFGGPAQRLALFKREKLDWRLLPPLHIHRYEDYDPSDIRTSIIAAISVKVTDPVFESQTKIKLGSKEIEPGVSMRNFVMDFLGKHLDDYLHKHADTAQVLQKKIVENEKERKAISGVQKKARETAKKVSLNNRKLRDCKIHRTDRSELAEQSMIFITEGNSASGSITKSRDVRTQAVFSLRGKPLNCFGLTKKVVYENEEFYQLQSALNIEEEMENLRYEKVIIATDADVDGMHIRLLLMTFFLQFFPEVIREGHLYVLQTPLFRVRNKKETHYCYSEEERLRAIDRCGANAEITRFKGLGEISPEEFREFIGENMRLDRVRITKDDPIHDLLEFYMGKNTFERQGFIIDNLRIEEDLVEEDLRMS